MRSCGKLIPYVIVNSLERPSRVEKYNKSKSKTDLHNGVSVFDILFKFYKVENFYLEQNFKSSIRRMRLSQIIQFETIESLQRTQV